MGNVQASSPPSSSFPGSPPPSPPLTAPPPLTTTPQEKIIPTPPIGNPGTFEELHKKCKGEPNIIQIMNVYECNGKNIFMR